MTSEPDRVRQMRAKAEELQERAKRVGDPAEHRRLSEKARRLREQSEKESGQSTGRPDL
ncbi:DUF6381 family protein [Streptomyces sp. TX20-6-3]|uniref:DUF6381 family protein n=1 Tax=Streptomyces sp. TX20-6-3 TaxID=3028705 RepID=UPI0029A9B3E1|nr:DUF6381 family protein [Streptomyces sp. TX20-6-3]MDX2565401.1 DUF6381 family protein [Streptomyces sp. TX20-6-3]